MYLLTDEIAFPPIEETSPEGILAFGGDLKPERLLLAYKNGIFPWYSHDEPIIWWSPDPRMILFPEDLKVSKSMKQLLRRETFKVTYNTAFERVIQACAIIQRPGQDDTWITTEMEEAYIQLHKMGYATSVEVWRDEKLVGGVYGIDLGHVFCGESMFSLESNASKYGFIHLVEKLKTTGCQLIDCQMHTNHLASLGAYEVPREVFLSYL
ncbi:Leucyl/phenylalanyl-tRNA--protein transferase [Kordia antarctica]|uniref:Leucyl/phenylalanyl-tRNA--protein transferase n=1 Tax=Kordia antarctica TaxID=1218801 RepID=A0A7L4ZKJ5_9FLAO|nr:leucyl/phenylalanyl-tRNA--protein transferase [Kordia antarctica]QHI37152.1 Leucyl/phenylalanyl-tRNA--protein transferase [Kordia antarctica]